MYKIGRKSKIRKYKQKTQSQSTQLIFRGNTCRKKKQLCSSLLRWNQVAAPNKTYCLLCLLKNIVWMDEVRTIIEKSFIIFTWEYRWM